MTIEIPEEELRKIKRHGEKTYPEECCGFLIGQLQDGVKKVILTKKVENARDVPDRHNRFLIPPQEYLAAEKIAGSEGYTILGFYHSHPDAEANPSQYDLDHHWPWYSYIIVSIKAKKAEVVNSWLLEDDRSRFVKEDIII